MGDAVGRTNMEITDIYSDKSLTVTHETSSYAAASRAETYITISNSIYLMVREALALAAGSTALTAAHTAATVTRTSY